MSYGKPDWNINKGFGDILADIIVEINTAALKGDDLMWFNSLRVLYRNVAGHKKMNKEAIKKINDSLKDVSNKLQQKSATTEKGMAYINQKTREVKQKLDEINTDLITEMHKAGLILGIKSSKAEFAALEIN